MISDRISRMRTRLLMKVIVDVISVKCCRGIQLIADRFRRSFSVRFQSNSRTLLPKDSDPFQFGSYREQLLNSFRVILHWVWIECQNVLGEQFPNSFAGHFASSFSRISERFCRSNDNVWSCFNWLSSLVLLRLHNSPSKLLPLSNYCSLFPPAE